MTGQAHDAEVAALHAIATTLAAVRSKQPTFGAIRMLVDAALADHDVSASDFHEVATQWERAGGRPVDRASTWPAWSERSRECGAAALRQAAEDYLRTNPDARRQGPAPLGQWLEGHPCGPAPVVGGVDHPAVAQAASNRQFPDPEVRSLAVALKGEAWVVSWLDPCGWDAGARCIAPRLGVAGDEIRRWIGRELDLAGVRVAERSKAVVG